MPHYANNMSPTATAGAHMGMGMPSYGMQPNTEVSPATWANNPPMYTSPAYTSPWANNPPTYTSPAYTAPAAYPQTMGHIHMHSHLHYGKPAPVYAAAAACGGASSVGIILVLFILLVIISRAIL
jgi:hypothetical protein